jgi:hypothetical protein
MHSHTVLLETVTASVCVRACGRRRAVTGLATAYLIVEEMDSVVVELQ